jgi:hypothetical protein
MDLIEIGLGGMDWIVLAQDRDKWRDPLNMVMNPRVPYIVGKILGSSTSVSRGAELHEVSINFCYTVFPIPLSSIIHSLYF